MFKLIFFLLYFHHFCWLVSNMAGGFDQEEEAARVYDLAHPFPVC